MNNKNTSPKDKKEYIRDGRSPLPANESISRVMQANKPKDTLPEITLRKSLYTNGIRGYRLHKKDIPGRPDISFPRHKVAIFVNGCFWHRCPKCKPGMPKTHAEFWQEKFDKNLARDKKKEKELRKWGWKVIIIWECEIKDDLSKSLKRIRRLLVL